MSPVSATGRRSPSGVYLVLTKDAAFKEIARVLKGEQ
jgi:hypothetical protein